MVNGTIREFGITKNYDMYEGHNITFNMPNIETVEIREQLFFTFFVTKSKGDINQSDVEFHELVKSESETKEPKNRNCKGY